MSLYIVAYFLFLYDAIVLKNIRIIQLLILLIVSIVIGFRSLDVGTDTHVYYDMYESLGINGYQGYPEILYGLSCVLAYSLGLSFAWHQTLLCLFSLLFAYRALLKTPNMGLSLFLLLTLCFFCYNLNVYSQLIACYICLYAVTFLIDNNSSGKIKFLLLVAFAMGFHLSAVFIVPLLWVNKLNLNKGIVFWGLFLSFVLGLVDITRFLSFILGSYSRYIDRDIDPLRLIRGAVLSFYWMIAFLFLYRTVGREYRKCVELKVFFIGILMYNSFLSMDLALRFMFYFSLPMVCWIPIYLRNSKESFRVRRQIVVMAYTTIYYIVILLLNSGDIVPYQIA